MVINRLPTQVFHEFRKLQTAAERMGQLVRGGEWDKMVIMNTAGLYNILMLSCSERTPPPCSHNYASEG